MCVYIYIYMWLSRPFRPLSAPRFAILPFYRSDESIDANDNNDNYDININNNNSNNSSSNNNNS